MIEKQICTRCIMDTEGDPAIKFESDGTCNYCNYALERIKRETVDFMENWLDCLENLEKLKTYTRFKEAAAR